MRPMKLGGDVLLFGENSLDYLKTMEGKKAFIVLSGDAIEKNGYLAKIVSLLEEAGMETMSYDKVEPDPTFDTVMEGTKLMLDFTPDWILGVGGGSAMDAAKAMWIFYEHPELKSMEDIIPPNVVPKLRKKARMLCIPTSSGTGSEVSRSIVISDSKTHIKYGVGDMEMMPDIVLLEPGITASMPKGFTAATGMDALTHAIEAYTSLRANEISDILAEKSIIEICKYLPLAYNEGDNLEYREKMLLYSCVSGMAFTNVSLGLVHGISHAVGGKFGVPHGLANAITLPYLIEFNMQDDVAKRKYEKLAEILGVPSLLGKIKELNKIMDIPETLQEVIKNDDEFEASLKELSILAKNDGCTKTNPIIPEIEQVEELYRKVYYGR
ncbi:MAG: iron-containing alcohol dehydrogenase [Epulopiscium sp.]|nr:iron-containing alcohol dehydrogenase [Candidatus Epulonipiscium sp.]